MLILAYPHEHMPPWLGVGEGQIITVDTDPLFDWPGSVEGPNPWTRPATEIAEYLELITMPGDVLVPLIEEAVLPCGFVQSVGIDRRIALRCVDRRLQRLALERTGLNPTWNVEQLPPGPQRRLVVKAPLG
jgi:hypothetical protein